MFKNIGAKAPKPTQKGDDPWAISDPWKEAASSSRGPELQLLPGTFRGQDDQDLPIIQHLEATARGVVMSTFKDAESYATAGVLLSDDELAAVVAGLNQPMTGKLECQNITFPALSAGNKVLHLCRVGLPTMPPDVYNSDQMRA